MDGLIAPDVQTSLAKQQRTRAQMRRTASSTDNGYKAPFFILFFIIAFWLPTQLGAQGYYHWNTADKNKLWVTEINPAIVSFQNTEISVGLKLFHVGFLQGNSFGLRESRINISAPYYLPFEIGVGMDIRHFTAGIYSEISSALLISKEIYPKFSIGAKVALDHRGFSKDEFNIVDEDDPLINSGLSVNALNLGLGAYWTPGKFRLGMGVDHLNTPNVGLISTSVYPKEVSGAIGYQLGMFTPTLLVHDNGIEIKYGFSVAYEKSNIGRLRLGYERTMPVKMEASINLTKKSQLHYGMDFPNEGTSGASYGTQEFVYSQILAKKPVIGQPEILFSTKKLDIIYETQVRVLAPDIKAADLQNSGELMGQYFTPIGHKDDLLFVKAGALSRFETDEIRQKRHLRIIRSIGQNIYQNPTSKVVIWADKRTLEDAKEIKYLLESKARLTAENINIAKIKKQTAFDLAGFEPGRKMVKRSKPRLSKERLLVHFRVSSRTRKTNGWQFVIKDSYGKPVRIFSGKGSLPKSLVWDWQDMDGHTATAGVYTGFLTVKADGNVERNARSADLPVYNIKRTVTMKFKREAEINLTKKQNQDSEILDAE